MAWGRGAAVGGAVVGVWVAACLPAPPEDPVVPSTTGSSSSGDTDHESTAPDLMTSTETPVSSTTGEPPSCVDQHTNQDETDVDCGGSCDPCPEGQHCQGNADCQSMACAAGLCVAPTCLQDAECGALAGACMRGVCDPQSFTCAAAPDHEGAPCDDGDLCSLASACQSGSCAATLPVDCSGFDSACTRGECDAQTGACLAVDLADDTPCDDGDACTVVEACHAGSCVTAEPGALLFEDFSAPNPGWVLDKLWEMGPAEASPAAVGGADPGDDHSPGADGRLAGTAIGGLDASPEHEPWCIVSPPVDTTKSATLWVSFWRHLHVPAQPKVIQSVDAWNGAAWKNLETGYDKTVNDADWVFVKFNATGMKAKDFRVRLCVERVAGSPDFAGWSIDDFTVAALPCTP